MCLYYNTRTYECGCWENIDEYIVQCEFSAEEGLPEYECPYLEASGEMVGSLCDPCYLRSLEPT